MDLRVRSWSVRARVRGVALFFMVLFGVLSCVAGLRNTTPVQKWWRARGPVVPHDTFPADCSLCHTGDGWRSIRCDFEFDHAAETGVPLEGAHAKAECLRCHNDRGPVEVFARRGCAGCHENVHRGQLGSNCADCHSERDWSPNETIARHNRTRFPLVGAHAAVACWRCHPGAQVGNFSRADTECITCHAADLAAAASPDHLAQGWTGSCDRCHIATTWSGGGFTHSTFPLTGAHVAADCSDCHVGGVFAGTPSQCVDCHLSDYNGATDPDHVAAGFPTNCEACHGTATWSGANFAHTSWRLTGAHTMADCGDCHLGGVYAGTPSQCVDCHLADYQATTSPDHAASGFPTTCDSCHGTTMWTGATFDHSFNIATGPHRIFDCMDCHTNPGQPLAFSCTHCHEHNQADTDDDHDRVPGYTWSSPACLSCHPNGEK